MGFQRLKGQEVEILMVVDGVAKSTITDVRNFEMAAKFDTLEEGYLGETSDRYDEVYKGVRGKFDLNFENPDVLDLIRQVVDRARRRTPGVQINIKASLNFPSGERARVLIPNVFFGELPMNVGGRAEYAMVTIDYSASDFSVLTT